MSGFAGEERYVTEDEALDTAAGTNAVAALQAGHPFSLLLAEDDRQRAIDLETLMDTVADPSTRFSRATNPLRARLTLERLLIQIIGGGPDIMQSDPAGIIRRIAEQRGTESRVILVVERAETLHPEVLRFFGLTAPLFPDGTPRLQVLFVGRPEFRRMLDDPDAGLDEQTAQLEAYRPREPEPSFAPPPEMSYEMQPQRPLPTPDYSLRTQFLTVWRRGWLVQSSIVGGVLIGSAAVAFAVTLALTGNDGPVQVDTGSALLEMPEPAETEPEPPVLQPGPPKDAATAQLRREFEAYLTASGRDIGNATAGQKRAVYQEFLVWRARTSAGRPGQ